MSPAFCADLCAGPELVMPIVRAQQRWGSALDVLEARGLVQLVAAREHDLWFDNACGGCDRELLREGERWLAICRTGFCQPDEVDPRRARVLAHAVTLALAAACGVEPGPLDAEFCVLGQRRIGGDGLLFAWCPRPSRVDPVRLDRLVDDHAPEALVVLAPIRSVAPPVRRRGRTRILGLGLADVWTHPDRLDLSELWLRFRLGSPDLLWPRYDLVVDGTRLLWGGRWVSVGRNPQHQALVQALLDAGDNYATRGDLLPVLFPDEFTNRGRVLTDPTKLDRRLRQLVSRLNAHAGAHPDGRSLVGNLRARSEVEGGYRIEVARDRRFTLQEDRHDV